MASTTIKVFLAASLLMLAMTQNVQGEDDTIVFESTETAPFWSETMPGGGMGGEILRLLSEQAGLKYSINYLPIKRFRASSAPYIVGDPGILTTDRHRLVIPIAIFHSAYFYYRPHHDAINIRSLDDLSGHTIGVLRGTIEGREQMLQRQIKLEEADSNESLVRMLKKGRIDVAILVDLAGQHLIETEFPHEQDNFVLHVIPRSVRPLAIMVDQDTANGKDISLRYLQVLHKVQHTQRYHQILQKYYGQDAAAQQAHQELSRLQDYYESTLDE